MSRHYYAVYWPYGVNTFNFDHEPIGTVSHSIRLKRVTLTLLLTGSTVIFIGACRIIDCCAR